MTSQPSSTPSKRVLSSTKRHESDEDMSRPASNQSQDSLKTAVGNELEDHTWELDAKTIAEILSPKTRKTPFQADHVDQLEDYENFTINAHIKALESIEPPTFEFPESKSERDHYLPLCDFLNKCVAACHECLGPLKGKYYDDLKFIVWDCEVKDGVAGAAALKPDLVGGNRLQEKDVTKAAGLHWRPPNPMDFQLQIPLEVKANWPELVRQVGTYARCLFSASHLRQYAMVLGYSHTESTFRFLFFHRGGLTSSPALDLRSQKDRHDILRIFLAILSWETPAHAGHPMWCNDGQMVLPGVTEGRVQVENVLHNTLSLRGRAPRVLYVCPPDSSKDPIVPCAESTSFGGPRPSVRLLAKANEESATESPPLPEGSTTRSVARKAAASRSKVSKAPASRTLRSMVLRSRGGNEKAIPGVSGSQTGPEDDNEKPAALITTTHTNGYPIASINHGIVRPSSEKGKDSALTGSGTVVKFSWVSKASRGIEPNLLQDCSGLFGTLKHYCSFLVCHDKDSLATNHLFLPDTQMRHWSLFLNSKRPATVEYRALWGYVSAYGGHSLLTASDPKNLILAVFHASLGWFNMMQKGYHHRDISIGNIVMLDEAVKTKPFEIIKTDTKHDNDSADIAEKFGALKINPSATWDVKLLATLKDLQITDQCCGFVIDGDMAIKMVDYFDAKERNDSRSGTYEFMSDDLLEAIELDPDYLQSPVDDLFSLYYTMQWAAVFHNREFATGKDVPNFLRKMREAISGDQRPRGTLRILDSQVLDVDEYGQFVADCHPFLRDWYSSLRDLRNEWKQCKSNLKKSKVQTGGSFYTSLFSAFAAEGVAQLAELVHKHTQLM